MEAAAPCAHSFLCRPATIYLVWSTVPSIFSSMNIICYMYTYRLFFERTGGDPEKDLSMRDLVYCLERMNSPFRIQPFRFRSPNEILSLTSSILLALLSFHHPDTQKIDKHYVVIDCERKIILDNSVPDPISFHNFTHKQLLQAISGSRLERVWRVMVSFKRRNETKYI